MSNPLVSIVITNFNQSQFIDEAILSATDQTHPNVEIVVVDDGSTNTEDQNYFKQWNYPEITLLLLQENKGVALARNNGAQKTQGEYLVFLDADDRIDPRFVEFTLDAIERDSALGWISTWWNDFGTSNHVYKPDYSKYPYLLLFKGLHPVTCLIRKTAFEQANGFYDFKKGFEDWDFWISLTTLGWSSKMIPEILFEYRRDGQSRTTNANESIELIYKQIIERHEQFYETHCKEILASVFAFQQDSSELVNTKTFAQRVFDRVVSKLSHRPMWWYERNRSYRKLQQQALSLPTVQTNTAAETTFAVLTQSSQYLNSIWVAWSWLRFLPESFHLKIFIDGKIDAKIEKEILSILPSAEIISMETYLETFSGPEAVVAFAKKNPYGKKFAVMIGESSKQATFYCDDDVLAFNMPHELQSALEKGDIPYYFKDIASAYSDVILDRLRDRGIKYTQYLNAGCLYLPKDTMSLSLAEELLNPWSSDFEIGEESTRVEQIMVCALLTNAGAKPFPEDRYVISEKRAFYSDPDLDYSTITARHFVYGVRHVMYLKGLPYLLAQTK